VTGADPKSEGEPLSNYRNHAETALALDGRHVCIFGDNGAGKTNLLEALSMLAPGRGLRGAEGADMLRKTDDGVASAWALSATLADGDGDRKIQLAYEQDPLGRSKRALRIDGAPATQGDLAEVLRIVWMTPSMDRVFAGPAGDRRRFFDRQVLAHFPAHAAAGAAYEKAMRERNALLEQGRADPSWLDGLEARMAEAGAVMAIHRADAAGRMQDEINQRPEGAFPKAMLTLDGEYEDMAAKTPDRGMISDAFAAKLRSGRSRDAAAGRALSGVHRTDLQVMHAPKQMPADKCSTGEQKALLIGLVLANASSLFSRDFAPNPLLLLDEAAAHLDADRRAALFDELAALGGQAWLTGTDESLFDAFGGRAQRFRATGADVREV
jgi:DNA replication and repair protein RecF